MKALLFFAAVTVGLGHTVLRLSRASRQANPLVRLLETAAVGLAAFSFLGVVLELLHLPIRPLVYMGVAGVVPVVTLIQAIRASRQPRASAWKTPETLRALLLVVMLGALFAVFYFGATEYPYLEDDDSWLHAEATLSVAKVHGYSVDPALRALLDYAKYLEPYPPTYDVIMGLMRQLDDSVYWTLKFFNVVLVTLAHGFFFLFCGEYLKDSAKGLFATLVLVVLPSFISHFIWSQSLAMCVLPVAMYATLRALDDATWTAPAIVAIASMMVTQPIVSVVFGVFFVLLVVSVFWQETQEAGGVSRRACPRTVRGLIVGASGVAASLLYWAAQIAKWGMRGIYALKIEEVTVKGMDEYAIQRYSLGDALFPPEGSRIDTAVGWGLAVTVAMLVGLLASAMTTSAKRSRSLHLVVWFLVFCYAVFASSLGLPAWAPARMWSYLAIPVALLATEGAFLLSRLGRASPRRQTMGIAIASVCIVATSAPAKIAVQAGLWPPGVQWTYAESTEGRVPVDLLGFLEMRQRLPANTRVYSFCTSDSRAIGFDMDASPWVRAEAEFRKRGANVTPGEALAFLEEHHYPYFTLDASCEAAWGEVAAKSLRQGLDATGRVTRRLERRGFLLAEVSPVPR